MTNSDDLSISPKFLTVQQILWQPQPISWGQARRLQHLIKELSASERRKLLEDLRARPNLDLMSAMIAKRQVAYFVGTALLTIAMLGLAVTF